MSDIKLIFEKQKNFNLLGKTKNINERIVLLKKLKKVIKNYEESISDSLRKDLRKSPFESYITEISIVYKEIDIQIKKLKKWSKPKRIKSPIVHFPVRSYIYPEPYGIVLIIGPFNYPFQLTLLPMVGAIAAGNTVMVKPSELASATSEIIRLILSETFREDYVAWIDPIKGKLVVEELLLLKFDYIFFTGSINVGKIIMHEAAKNLIPITLELGGKSPCIIDEDANIKIAARRIVWGKFLNSGQTCVAPDYLYIHKKIESEFLEELVKEIKKQYGENSLYSKDYTRIINEIEFNRLKSYINKSKIFYGGTCIQQEKYIEPTILKDVKWDDEVMKREIFGPIIPTFTFNKLDLVIKEINERDKPLAVYYFSDNKNKIQKVIEETSSGGITINDTVIQASSTYLPFGGVGASGMGRYHGKASFDLFSHKKSIMKRDVWLDISIRYAPFKDKLKVIKKILK